MNPAPPDAAWRLAGFCRALRRAGLPVALGEELDAGRSILALDDPSPEDFHDACQIPIVKDPADADLFDAVFAAYWSQDFASMAIPERELDSARPDATHATKDAGDDDVGMIGIEIDETAARAVTPIRTVLYSADAPARSRVLQTIDQDRLRIMERRARHLRRRLATLAGRRFRPSTQGRIDFRLAARRSMRYAGEWMTLPHRTKALRRTRLLILWDVSGSMEEDHVEHLGLVFALQRVTRAARIFAFGTDLHEVTHHLRSQPYRAAVTRMARSFEAWGGGTRIGESLAKVNALCGSWIDRRTVVAILSDGWDIGNLSLLSREMKTLHRRSGLVVWLNPNADDPGFRPESAGMEAALPHIDVFLSADVLSNPQRFRRELGPSLTPFN